MKLLTRVLLAALVTVAGCSTTARTEKVAPAERIKVKVTTAVAARRTITRERRILGTLEPYREADLAPAAPGRVRSLPFKIGDHVKAGQTVAQMDDVQLVALIAQYQPLKAQYERSQVLLASNAVSKAQFEGIEAQYVAMKRQVESLQENTTLKAPFAGVVTARAVEEGEMFSSPMAAMPGQSKGLIRITQLDPLKLDIELDDETARHIAPRARVRLHAEDAPDTALWGTVEWLNPRADPVSRTFQARIVVPNPRGALKPGYFTEARIALAEKTNALAIPATAVVDNRVFVLSGKTAIARTVTLGWQTDDYAEILSGLEDSATVITSGNKALPDSAEVEVTN